MASVTFTLVENHAWWCDGWKGNLPGEVEALKDGLICKRLLFDVDEKSFDFAFFGVSEEYRPLISQNLLEGGHSQNTILLYGYMSMGHQKNKDQLLNQIRLTYSYRRPCTPSAPDS